MSVKPHLQTSLSQRLVLTPQMRQRIEMLQMTKLELSDMILAELDQNIMLESLEPGDGAEEVAEGEAAGEAAAPEASNAGEDVAAPEFSAVEMTVEAPVGEGEADLGADVEQRDAFDEIDYGQTFEDYLDPGYKTQERETREEFSFENFLSRPPSLTDQLMWQLGLSDIEGDIRDAAEAIIGNLDENGYLAATYEEIAEMGSWPLEVVEAAHREVMHLDPIGIGARGARECLLVQLEALGEADHLATRLVRDHWDHLPKHKLPELSRQIGISVDQLIVEVDRIRLLDPYPGRRFSVDDSQYIEPEVSIEKVDDDYVIRFNDDGLPLLRINRTYRQMMLAKDTSKEAKDFIKDKFRSAIDLLKNIEHRPADDPAGLPVDRRTAARLPGPWRGAPAPDDAQGHRRGHRHAPVDRLARGEPQVRAHSAGCHRAAAVFHRGHEERRRRGRLDARAQAEDQEDDRSRGSPESDYRRRSRATPRRGRREALAAHGGEVSRPDAHRGIARAPGHRVTRKPTDICSPALHGFARRPSSSFDGDPQAGPTTSRRDT